MNESSKKTKVNKKYDWIVVGDGKVHEYKPKKEKLITLKLNKHEIIMILGALRRDYLGCDKFIGEKAIQLYSKIVKQEEENGK